ncbi:MAG TPA: tripartite tricarboxylate transporter TctB family protein [Xanthobacteraceae bacterium]|nr:tripartite tricarboxylate transporter TctB family protein [Xanthobacteraceae bacterium]
MKPARHHLADGDLVSGAVLAALGVYIVATASQWPLTTVDGPGAGFFPAVYGALLLVLSLVLIAGRMRRAASVSEPTDWRGIGRAFGTWAAFVAAIGLMVPLGFTISFGLMAWFIVTVIFGKSVLAGGLTAILSSAGFYLLFVMALGVDLPVGMLGV